MNHLFARDFGEEFQPLDAAGRFPDPAFGPAVELLVTDKQSYAESELHWRRGEAKHVARRLRELVDAGEATPGEIVLLFAAGTDAEWYEEELRALGLPTHRGLGRGYFGQQQVVDLLSYLRLLHNRYDDEALVAVLASPFVGVSNDALVLLRRAATRRPLFVGLERSLPPGSPQRTSSSSARSGSASTGSRRRRERLPLEQLCERIVADHDYDLAVLAQWDGRRRYANLRKLARLARSYEELRGPDVEGFVALRPRAGRRRRARDRGGRGGGGRRRHPPPHDPCGEGARVQGRRRRRRRPRALRRHARRDPGAAGRALRLQGRPSGHRRARPRLRLRRGEGGRARRRRGGAPPPLLRRDDARDRPPDRVRLDRPGAGLRREHADRLGAHPPRREELADAGEAPLVLDRDGAQVVVRVDRGAAGRRAAPAPVASPAAEPRRRRGRPARALRRRSTTSAHRRRRRACPSSCRSRRRRCTACGASPSRRSPSSSAAPTATTSAASPA